jgi:hypothetical protein
MQDLPSIHFWGPWTPTERHTIAEAIDHFESRHKLSEPTLPAVRPWIAVVHDLPNDGRYCFASRIGIANAFTGTSARDLAEAITNTNLRDMT